MQFETGALGRVAAAGVALAVMVLAVGSDAAEPARPETATTSVTVANPTSKPVPNRDVDNPVRNAYIHNVAVTCTNTTCYLDFPVTTATETLIRNISCSFYIPSGTSVFYAFLDSWADNRTASVPLPVFAFNTTGNSYYGINSQIYLPVPPGVEPQFVMEVTGEAAPQDLSCLITGSTVD